MSQHFNEKNFLRKVQNFLPRHRNNTLTIKEKFDKFDQITIKNFCLSKDTIKI